MKHNIMAMIDAAIGGDILASEGGFVSIMGKSASNIQQDIPAAFEAYTLLAHFITHLPVAAATLSPSSCLAKLSPAILYDTAAARLVALLPIGTGELDAVAHWLTEHVPSKQIKRMGGILALPFSIEEHSGTKHLLPEWFAAFYVHGELAHCVPILTLRSVLADPRFNGDWVNIALERMSAFSLPQEQAKNAAKQVDAEMQQQRARQ